MMANFIGIHIFNTINTLDKKIWFCLTVISILLKRDIASYNIYYDRVPN